MPSKRTDRLKPDMDPIPRRDNEAAPLCRGCGRPHGAVVRCLPDGRWYDPNDRTWRDGRGRRSAWPDMVEYTRTKDVRVVVRAVLLSGDKDGRRRLLCPRCQMLEENVVRAARARIRRRAREALGDLFLGSYERMDALVRNIALYGDRSAQTKRRAKPSQAPPRSARGVPPPEESLLAFIESR